MTAPYQTPEMISEACVAVEKIGEQIERQFTGVAADDDEDAYWHDVLEASRELSRAAAKLKALMP